MGARATGLWQRCDWPRACASPMDRGWDAGGVRLPVFLWVGALARCPGAMARMTPGPYAGVGRLSGAVVWEQAAGRRADPELRDAGVRPATGFPVGPVPLRGAKAPGARSPCP